MRSRESLVVRGMLVVAGMWGVQGCMPDLVVVGRGTGGATGATAGAGAGGKAMSAGASGVQGDQGGGAGSGGAGRGGRGGTSGRAGASTAGSSARAGRAGAGGSVPSAGAGGHGATGGNGAVGGSAAAAGNGATGGDDTMPAGSGGGAGAPFTFDESCNCRVDGDHEFYCSIDPLAFQNRVEPPTSCDNDLDYVHRTTAGPTITYQWSEGTENEYELVLNFGFFSYFKAYGYVGRFCDIGDPNYDLGTVEVGTPVSAVDGNDCSVCEGGSGIDPTPGLPACEPCSSTPPSFTNHEPLADFCAFHACPADLAAARATVAAECPPMPARAWDDATISTGCGYIRVERLRQLGTEAFYFDSQSEALVGVALGGDTPGGACYAVTYDGGDVPTQTCADASTCTLCDYTSGTAGSGAGGAGSAGMSGDPAPPRCP